MAETAGCACRNSTASISGRKSRSLFVMAGPVPATHVWVEVVDARHKAGHDIDWSFSSNRNVMNLQTTATSPFAIGQPVLRAEDPKLLRGHGRYTDDVNLPGQAYAVIVRSTQAHGR